LEPPALFLWIVKQSAFCKRKLSSIILFFTRRHQRQTLFDCITPKKGAEVDADSARLRFYCYGRLRFWNKKYFPIRWRVNKSKRAKEIELTYACLDANSDNYGESESQWFSLMSHLMFRDRSKRFNDTEGNACCKKASGRANFLL